MSSEIRLPSAPSYESPAHLLSCQALFPTPAPEDLCARTKLESYDQIVTTGTHAQPPATSSCSLEGCDQRHSAGSVGARVDRAVLSSPAGPFADISRYMQTDTLVSALQFAQVSFSYPPYSEDNSTTLSQVVFARSRSHGPSLDPPQYTALRIAPAELALLRTQPATPSALRVAKPTAVESLVRNSYEIISIS